MRKAPPKKEAIPTGARGGHPCPPRGLAAGAAMMTTPHTNLWSGRGLPEDGASVNKMAADVAEEGVLPSAEGAPKAARAVCW